ncbi:MAG TPA: hypothetical protein VKQ05_02415 [Gemmatimonadales bacterium]|nr:hypothetical protein [Gemmatimonadales bacterium]
MRPATLLFTVCLMGFATLAVAQRPAAKPKPARHAAAASTKLDVAGTWTIENTIKTAAGADTVVNSELVATATRQGWVTHLANRDPIPTRVVAMGGDSVVIAAGPFQSVVRAGLKVTTRETLHFQGDNVSGTMAAHYSTGQIVKGMIKGTRKK